MRAFIFTIFIIMPLHGYSQKIHLNLAVRDSYDYISELLVESLELQGHQVSIKGITNLPHQRVMDMLKSGDVLSLHWRGQSPKWDFKFTTVEVDLTGGLKGHRVLFIPEKKQVDYDGIDNLDDFRRLGKIGGFGKGWSDIDIWKANRLAYYEVDGGMESHAV